MSSPTRAPCFHEEVPGLPREAVAGDFHVVQDLLIGVSMHSGPGPHPALAPRGRTLAPLKVGLITQHAISP